MSNYALIKNGIVANIIVADSDFIDSLPNSSDYVQYTNAGIGWIYDASKNVFIPPKPYPSWSLDDNLNWQAPTPRPTEGFWYWDEENLMWQQLES